MNPRAFTIGWLNFFWSQVLSVPEKVRDVWGAMWGYECTKCGRITIEDCWHHRIGGGGVSILREFFRPWRAIKRVFGS